MSEMSNAWTLGEELPEHFYPRTRELDRLLRAMAADREMNDTGYLPGEMSNLFSGHLAKLEPYQAEEWRGPTSKGGRRAKIPPKQVWGLLRKHQYTPLRMLAGGYRLSIEKIDEKGHPRSKRKSLRVFKALTVFEADRARGSNPKIAEIP